LQDLEADSKLINAVLAEQVGAVERAMAGICPVVALLQRVSLMTETTIINFNLEIARDVARSRAQSLAALSPGELTGAIDQMDREVALFGNVIVNPPPPLDLELQPILAVEYHDIRKNLEILAQD